MSIAAEETGRLWEVEPEDVVEIPENWKWMSNGSSYVLIDKESTGILGRIIKMEYAYAVQPAAAITKEPLFSFLDRKKALESLVGLCVGWANFKMQEMKQIMPEPEQKQ